MKVTQSCPTLCDPVDYTCNSSGQNTGVGSFSLHQGIFLTQESSQGLLHCRQILYQLSYQGSPEVFVCLLVILSCMTLCDPMDPPGSSVHEILQARILEWVAVPFSRGSSQPRSLALQADSLLAKPPGKRKIF